MSNQKVSIQIIDGEWGSVKSSQGKIEFLVDSAEISILGISVQTKHYGIGSTLLRNLEDLCLQRNIRRITVPSTPSKEALSFWLDRGYRYVFSEDKNIGDMILNSDDSEKIENTDSGIILLEKALGGLNEKPK